MYEMCALQARLCYNYRQGMSTYKEQWYNRGSSKCSKDTRQFAEQAQDN